MKCGYFFILFVIDLWEIYKVDKIVWRKCVSKEKYVVDL